MTNHAPSAAAPPTSQAPPTPPTPAPTALPAPPGTAVMVVTPRLVVDCVACKTSGGASPVGDVVVGAGGAGGAGAGGAGGERVGAGAGGVSVGPGGGGGAAPKSSGHSVHDTLRMGCGGSTSPTWGKGEMLC